MLANRSLICIANSETAHLGAQIVADTAQIPGTAQVADHLAGVVILSDPHFNPHDTATAAGTFDLRYGGAPQRPPFPPTLAPKIRSYCASMT
jgi:hypothetical protein